MESLPEDDGACSDNDEPFEDAIDEIDPELEPNAEGRDEADQEPDNLVGLNEGALENGLEQQGDPEPPNPDQYPTTRSGREVKPPKRLVAEPSFGVC